MATARDVALHILETQGAMGTMKLQKLVFYSQAYSLAWFKKPMFENRVEAWVHGPVIRDLWDLHRKQYEFDAEALKRADPSANANNLTDQDRLVIKSVLHGVGALSGLDLKDRTHAEAPWKDAFDKSEQFHDTEITKDAMMEYYAH